MPGRLRALSASARATPSIHGAPPQLTAAITSGSHEAFMAGLQLSMWVGAAAAAVGAVLALFVRRGEA